MPDLSWSWNSWDDWDKPLEAVNWTKVSREPFKRAFLALPARCELRACRARPAARAGKIKSRAKRNRELLRRGKVKRTSKARRNSAPAGKTGTRSEASKPGALREVLQIRVDEDPYGDCPDPVSSFTELGILPKHVIENLKAKRILKPLPIQAQTLPLVLAGRDVIGLAQTGSGKTLAFLLPAVVHVQAQAPVQGGSPVVLVLAPTRELAVQIGVEAEKIASMKVCSIYGGGDKKQQLLQLRGPQVLAATPGRLVDFVRAGAVSLHRVTYFVLDEADRMLDMGFQGDVTGISGQVRPERQMLFFSATWSADVQKLAVALCHSQPVRISVGQGNDGQTHMARRGVEQEVVVVDHGDWKQQEIEKNALLEKHLRKVLSASKQHKVLVFVSQKKLADDLAWKLQREGFDAGSMHGGKSQENRLWVLEEFRQGRLRLLICTDVLGRGIDIPSVSHVVIHEMGAIEDYIHRIGRTARGKEARGHALVFFEYWEKDPQLAQQLIEVLEASEQRVPAELQRIAAEVAAGKRRTS